jgi:hypothetical protein
MVEVYAMENSELCRTTRAMALSLINSLIMKSGITVPKMPMGVAEASVTKRLVQCGVACLMALCLKFVSRSR